MTDNDKEDEKKEHKGPWVKNTAEKILVFYIQKEKKYLWKKSDFLGMLELQPLVFSQCAIRKVTMMYHKI